MVCHHCGDGQRHRRGVAPRPTGGLLAFFELSTSGVGRWHRRRLRGWLRGWYLRWGAVDVRVSRCCSAKQPLVFLGHPGRGGQPQLIGQLTAVPVQGRQRFFSSSRVVQSASQEQDAALPQWVGRDCGADVREDRRRVAAVHPARPALMLQERALLGDPQSPGLGELGVTPAQHFCCRQYSARQRCPRQPVRRPTGAESAARRPARAPVADGIRPRRSRGWVRRRTIGQGPPQGRDVGVHESAGGHRGPIAPHGIDEGRRAHHTTPCQCKRSEGGRWLPRGWGEDGSPTTTAAPPNSRTDGALLRVAIPPPDVGRGGGDRPACQMLPT